MKYWLSVTDNKWFEFLATKNLDEVNFWQPSDKPLFVKGFTGMPFLFKLKRPNNHIAGGGFYVTNSILPMSIAWEIFGEKNGASSLEEFKYLIEPLIANKNKDPLIGCTVLANPIFLNVYDWIKNPVGWSSNIVRGKMYDTDESEGMQNWGSISKYFINQDAKLIVSEQNIENPRVDIKSKYGQEILTRPRLGQATFRLLVTEAYNRRCAMTGENTLVVLEAAHIIPYSNDESNHDVTNGLLLRSDFHTLYDKGLVSVTGDYQMKISPKIRETWYNGKAYYRLDNQPLQVLPSLEKNRPDPDKLNWHFKNIFQN